MSKKKKTPEEIVNDIQEACKLLGWAIAMDESDHMISGLIIGRFAFVEATLEQLEEKDNYSIYQTGEVNTSIQ